MKRTRKTTAAEEAARAERTAVVVGGVCPTCSSPLVRNLSLTGWYQCAAYGAPGFRGAFDGTGRAHPEFDLLPACSFQVFA